MRWRCIAFLSPLLLQLLSIDETARMLSLSPKTLRRWVHEKKIPYVKIGGAVRFNQRNIENWLKRKEIEEHSVWR